MCGNDCFEIGPPPPDTILSLPPPPLPAFLLPRSGKLNGNEKEKKEEKYKRTMKLSKII